MLDLLLAVTRRSGQYARVSREFLVAYDYGMGGLWAIVLAESADEITTRHPEVKIADTPPGWMNEEELARLRREPLRVDLPQDEGVFKAVVAERSK